jgi:hypothetical protein
MAGADQDLQPVQLNQLLERSFCPVQIQKIKQKIWHILRRKFLQRHKRFGFKWNCVGSAPTLHEDKSNLIMSSAGDKSEQPKANSVQEFSTDLLRVYYGKS